ncbi:hypothetical protein SGLAM104S_02721 [Streptomyces glaucescens]|jgi:hypothetical protein
MVVDPLIEPGDVSKDNGEPHVSLAGESFTAPRGERARVLCARVPHR